MVAGQQEWSWAQGYGPPSEKAREACWPASVWSTRPGVSCYEGTFFEGRVDRVLTRLLALG
jgi:hypothetical protein